MAASNADSVHAVTGAGGADSRSQVVEGGSGHSICQVRGTEMVSDAGAFVCAGHTCLLCCVFADKHRVGNDSQCQVNDRRKQVWVGHITGRKQKTLFPSLSSELM